MKKIVFYLFILMLSFMLVACDKKSSANEYAYVNIRFYYQESTVEDWKADFYDKNNWSHSDVNIYEAIGAVYLTYSNQKDLLKDFPKFVDSLDYTDDIYIRLHTVGKEFAITETATKEDLIALISLYEYTEIKYDNIPYEQLYLSEQETLLNGALVIDSYNHLLSFAWHDRVSIDTSFFEEKVLIVVGGIRSGSLEINGIDQVFYLNNHTLEVAIKSSAGSEYFTDDEQYWTIILSIDKDRMKNINRIISHHHVTFKNNYLADVPFHNTLDNISDDYVDMIIEPPFRTFFNENEHIETMNYYPVYLVNTDGKYELFNGNFLTEIDTSRIGKQQIYIYYRGFVKSFEVEVFPNNDDVSLVYSGKPTVSLAKIDDGYIDDFDSYLLLNLDLALDESFFDHYSLYLKRYISSDTNLTRQLIKSEVFFDRLHLYLYKPNYGAGQALTGGQLIFKISKDLRLLGDEIEFVDGTNYLLKENTHFAIDIIDPSFQYQHSYIKSEIKGFITDSVPQYPDTNYANTYLYHTYEDFMKDYGNIVLEESFNLDYFDLVYFGRKNLMIIEVEIMLSVNGYTIHMPNIVDDIVTFTIKNNDGELQLQKILIFKSVSNKLLEENPKVEIILR